MRIAVDENGNRIDIDDSAEEKAYFCPLCNGRVIMKKGKFKAHHFAHKSNKDCDEWSSDMSEWHSNWQKQFPVECRECVIEHNGVKHRADVKIGDTIIEFQHSPISNEEFNARNEFYLRAGYVVIWLFDLREQYYKQLIKEDGNNVCMWSWGWKTFQNVNLEKFRRNMNIYFHFHDGNIYQSSQIAKIQWIDSNVSCFKKGNEYSINEFTSRAVFESFQNLTQDEYSIFDVKDTLVEDYDGFYQCFAQHGKRVPFENCDCCKYSIHCINKESVGMKGKYKFETKLNAEYYSGCLYRFKDLLLNWDYSKDKVLLLEKNFDEHVMKIVISKNGQKYKKEYEPVLWYGKTIQELAVENYNASVIGVINTKTKERYKIGGIQKIAGGHIYRISGYKGIQDKKEYYRERVFIPDATKRLWRIEWKK